MLPTPIPTMDPLGLTHDVYTDYGLLGLVIFLIIFFVLPPLLKKAMPFLAKGWQDEKRRSELREERQVKAMEAMTTALQNNNVILAAMDVRISSVQIDVDCIKTVVLQEKPKRKKVLAAAAAD
jgi:hypothetical protein